MANLNELLFGNKPNEPKGVYGQDMGKALPALERLSNFIETQNLEVHPEPQPIPGQMQAVRTDQVQNYAGGYVFKVDDVSRVRRFLILGTSGGTYYATEKEITMDNVKALCEVIEKGKGLMLLREIVDISLAGRSPKQDSIIFALALCARYKVRDTTKRNFENPLLKKYMGKMTSGELPDDFRYKVREEAKALAEEYEKEQRSKQRDYKLLDAFNQQAPAEAYADYQRALQKMALYAVQKVCRIPTHLFMFVKFCKKISSETGAKENTKGWGRTMRATIAQWYFNQTPERLAMHVTKYKSREGYSHRDLFRLCHVCPSASLPKSHLYWQHHAEYDFVFKYVVDGELEDRKRKAEGDAGSAEAKKVKKETKDEKAKEQEQKRLEAEMKRMKLREQHNVYLSTLKPKLAESLEASKAYQLINAYESAKKETDPVKVVKLIKDFGLVREHIPSELLNSKEIWIALLENMPMTAMIRNLGKMSSINMLGTDDSSKPNVAKVVSKLTDEKSLHDAKIHPVSVLLASSVYTKGCGFRGDLKWEPNKLINEALEKAFFLAFKNVTPTNKRYCLGLDVSGSMCEPISNSALSCREAAAALSMVLLRTEPKVEVVAFSHRLTELNFDRSTTLKQMDERVNGMEFGSTDCALPMLWAMEKKKEFDVFVVYTDCETWFGDVHPFEALKQYREKMNIPDARLIVMGMTATGFTIADPNDAGMLDICGFDSAVPELVKEFVLGNI